MPTAKVIIPADLRQIIRPSAENISFGNSGSPKTIVLIPCSTLGHNRPPSRAIRKPLCRTGNDPANCQYDGISNGIQTPLYLSRAFRTRRCRTGYFRSSNSASVLPCRSSARTRIVRPETSTRTTVPVPLTITGKRMSPAEGGASKGFSGASTIIGTRSFSSVGCISS